jgi:hypothetical protein
MRRLGVPICVLAAVAGLVLAGCGGGTELDSGKLEETLPHDLRHAVNEPIKSASCPSGIKVEKGNEFTCEIVLASGEKKTAKLKLLNEEADYAFLGFSSNK